MPIQIGEFISEHVYDGKLKSQHSITSPNCLAFVDVDIGVESPEDKSWKVCHIAYGTVSFPEVLCDLERTRSSIRRSFGQELLPPSGFLCHYAL